MVGSIWGCRILTFWYTLVIGKGVGIMREDLIRGLFSFFAAAVLLTMAAEYFDHFGKHRTPASLLVALLCAGLAIMEADKVLQRANRLLGLRVEGVVDG